MAAPASTFNYNPPGPTSGPFGLKTYLAFQGDVLKFIHDISHYGDIVRFKLGPKNAFLLQHPDQIHQILVQEVDKYSRPDIIKRVLGHLIGKGLLISDGAYWRRQRQLIQPAFHHHRIESYASTMVIYTQRMIDEWQNGQIRDISSDMQRLALDIVAKALFDSEDPSFATRVHEVAARLQTVSGRRMRMGINIDWLPIPENWQYRRDLSVLHTMMMEIISARKKSEIDTGDVLSMLMSVRDNDNSQLSDQQIMDEAITLLLAGHDTTALALGWMFYEMAKNPQIAEKLQKELDTVLGNRLPTFEDYPKLDYAGNIVKEVMRLYPSAYFASRQVNEDTELGGYRIPKGSALFYFTYYLHRDPRFFVEPERFWPERWENNFEKSLPRGAYVPFSTGPHVCIGNQFALMEMRLLLATVARQVRFTDIVTKDVHPVPHITLYPSSPIQLAIAKQSN